MNRETFKEYKKQEALEKEDIVMENRKKWLTILKNHFKDEKNIAITMTTKEDSSLYKLENYINPSYELYSCNKKIILIKEYDCVPSLQYLSGKYSKDFQGYYDNLLLLSACILDCTLPSDLNKYKHKFEKEYSSREWFKDVE